MNCSVTSATTSGLLMSMACPGRSVPSMSGAGDQNVGLVISRRGPQRCAKVGRRIRERPDIPPPADQFETVARKGIGSKGVALATQRLQSDVRVGIGRSGNVDIHLLGSFAFVA